MNVLHERKHHQFFAAVVFFFYQPTNKQKIHKIGFFYLRISLKKQVARER